MQIITLRNFKEQDVKSVEICLKAEVIPILMTAPNAEDILQDYMSCDGVQEIAKAICLQDTCIGGVTALAVEEGYMVSMYLEPSWQYKGYGKMALEAFEQEIARLSAPNAGAIRLCVNYTRNSMIRLAIGLSYQIEAQNEFGVTFVKQVKL